MEKRKHANEKQHRHEYKHSITQKSNGEMNREKLQEIKLPLKIPNKNQYLKQM